MFVCFSFLFLFSFPSAYGAPKNRRPIRLHS
jgi:hypothetical protein